MGEIKWENSGNILRDLRKKTKLSVFKVAKRIHISGNYLSMLERGINAPSDTVLFNLADFYEVNPAELFKLYDRIVPPSDQQLTVMPSLKKIMTEISIDSKLTPEEKEAFAKQLYSIANGLIKKE